MLAVTARAASREGSRQTRGATFASRRYLQGFFLLGGLGSGTLNALLFSAVLIKEFFVADLAIINPRFEVSYWGMEHALPLFGKKANLPVACLPLLAALTPPEHRVTLFDENVEPLDFDQLARFDLVGLTGMSVQRFRMREILQELKARGVMTVVGGPWVTVEENYFDGLADVIFVGEAEETWPQFLADWRRGDYCSRYEQAERTDMTRVPCPVTICSAPASTCSAACSFRAGARFSANSATLSSPLAAGHGLRPQHR